MSPDSPVTAITMLSEMGKVLVSSSYSRRNEKRLHKCLAHITTSPTISYKFNVMSSNTEFIDLLFKFYLDDEDGVGVGLVGGDEGELAEDGRDGALHFEVFADK